MENKWVGIVYVLIISSLHVTRAFEKYDPITNNNEDKSRVQVRAVFVNCRSENTNLVPDSDATRFEQHELFKHSALTNCDKKLTLTVKITSESDKWSGDEYLPIEHVFEGSNKNRVRLLDPYILRLRRDVPLQAYKLRKIEVVHGVLLDPLEPNEPRERSLRGLGHSEKRESKMTSEGSAASHQLQPPSVSTTEINTNLKKCEKNNNCRSQNIINERYKRKDRNVVMEEVTDDNIKWIAKEHTKERGRQHKTTIEDEEKLDSDESTLPHKPIRKKENIEIEHVPKNNQRKLRPLLRTVMVSKDKFIKEEPEFDEPYSPVATDGATAIGYKSTTEYNKHDFSNIYTVYEIGTPQVWYDMHVQLFEKLSTPEGKTVWNDLTKGNLASVSSLVPEWTGQDLNVRYRSTKWIPREEFTLPSNHLCLLVPLENKIVEYVTKNKTSDGMFDDTEYIVIPEEDIMDLKAEDVKIKRYDNNESDSESVESNRDAVEEKYRNVAIRLSRSVLKENEETPKLIIQGNDKYLTLRHRRPHTVQIDVEARADENELIHVGSAGRISVAVADSTRRTRTILNLQVGNTGLAAASFSVAARDFEPLLPDLMKDKEVTVAGPILIPPRHTRSIRLELPIELPVDVAHCSVSLINDQEQPVAVRDVVIKKGDRCFCVWHCDCVCLNDDPRLMCNEMNEAGMKAAGLAINDRPRHTRSISYSDVIPLNMFVVFTGIVFTLLLLGLAKAIVGLVCRNIGTWGLPQLLQVPRKLDKYYEASLQNRTVEYDKDNWPIHPDTKNRTVRFLSVPMEFMLNVIFFVSVPCILLYELIKGMIAHCNAKDRQPSTTSPHSPPSQTKDVYSTHDMQAAMPRRRRLRDGLRRWMTPQAQELSTELWRKSFNVRTALNNDSMQPLLQKNRSRDDASNQTQDLSIDSEQDDTDYVLTQMQKSRESLALSQKSLYEHLKRLSLGSWIVGLMQRSQKQLIDIAPTATALSK